MNDSSRAAQNLLHEEAPAQEPLPTGRHPEVLELSGNAQSMARYRGRQYERGRYRYLKFNVMGTGVHSFDYCVFYALLVTGVLFLFPLLLLCSHRFRTKLFKLVGVGQEVYEAMGEVVGAVDPEEVYVVVEDNFFDEAKAYALAQALNRTRTRKF